MPMPGPRSTGKREQQPAALQRISARGQPSLPQLPTAGVAAVPGWVPALLKPLAHPVLKVYRQLRDVEECVAGTGHGLRRCGQQLGG